MTSYKTKVVIDATFEPFTLNEAKNYLKVDTTADDSLITGLISAVRVAAEKYTSVSFVAKTYEQAFDDFSCLQLAVGGVNSVTSLNYIDEAGDLQTVLASEYGLNSFATPAHIFLRTGKSWPKISSEPVSVIVRFVAGANTVVGIPGDVKIAMQLMLADAYENRTDSMQRFPRAAHNLLELHRLKFFV